MYTDIEHKTVRSNVILAQKRCTLFRKLPRDVCVKWYAFDGTSNTTRYCTFKGVKISLFNYQCEDMVCVKYISLLTDATQLLCSDQRPLRLQ